MTDLKILKDTHIEKMREALAKSLDEFNPDQILEDITSKLRESRHQAVWAALGLDNRWGGWEVSQSFNGRASPIGEWITSEIKDKLRAFMQELVASEIDNIKKGLRTKVKAAIVKEITAQSDWQLRKMVETTVEEVSASVVSELRGEIEKELGL